MSKFTITVKRGGCGKLWGPELTFKCEHIEEAGAIRDAFHTAYYPYVSVTIVSADGGRARDYPSVGAKSWEKLA